MASQKRGAQLKTIADWHRCIDHLNGSDASRAGVHRSPKGPVDQARRLVIRAYRLRLWGLPGRDYKAAAERLTAAGYRTTEQDFKNATRARGGLPERPLIPAAAEGVVEFVGVVLSIWPDFEWRRLVQGDIGANLREIEKVRRLDTL
jgi:hypothetical protein